MAFEDTDPIVQPAYAWYSLMTCHPFLEGNGRVGRTMASVHLYPVAGIPFLIFVTGGGRCGGYGQRTRW